MGDRKLEILQTKSIKTDLLQNEQYPQPNFSSLAVLYN